MKKHKQIKPQFYLDNFVVFTTNIKHLRDLHAVFSATEITSQIQQTQNTLVAFINYTKGLKND